MSRVHGEQHFPNLGAAALPHHQPVWPHPQGRAHQIRQLHCTGTLNVGPAGHQRNNVGVRGGKFLSFFHGDNPFAWWDKAQQCGQEGGFPGARPA
jgi:hypothetical protein